MSCDFITLVPSLRILRSCVSLPSVTHLRPSKRQPLQASCPDRHGRLGVSLSVGCGARVFVAKSDPADIFASSTGNFNNITLDHLLKNNSIAGNTGHFCNEIDLTCSVGLNGMQVDNIVPARLATTDFSFRASGLQTLCQLQFCLRQSPSRAISKMLAPA